jgi:hypothetical protein
MVRQSQANIRRCFVSLRFARRCAHIAQCLNHRETYRWILGIGSPGERRSAFEIEIAQVKRLILALGRRPTLQLRMAEKDAELPLTDRSLAAPLWPWHRTCQFNKSPGEVGGGLELSLADARLVSASMERQAVSLLPSQTSRAEISPRDPPLRTRLPLEDVTVRDWDWSGAA